MVFFPHQVSVWRLWLIILLAVPVVIAAEVYEYVRREIDGEGN